MDWITNNPNAYWIALALPFVALMLLLASLQRRRMRRRLADVAVAGALLPRHHRARQVTRATFLLAGMALCVLAAGDLRWGKTTVTIPRKGVDLVFALDVSRSMLATDASPNRLKRAKQFILDLAEASPSDRIALLTFAGQSHQSVPLTSNHSDLSNTLDEVSTTTVNRGGTKLGDALRAAADCFVDRTADHKAIVLITDGEDQDSNPVKVAAELLKNKGIRTYTIAIGDTEKGSRIPIGFTRQGRVAYVQHQGKDVWSKANVAVLEDIALAGGGAFIPAGTKSVPMDDVYRVHLATLNKREYRHGQVDRYTARFQWFLAPGLFLLIVQSLIGTGKRRASRRTAWNGWATTLCVLLAIGSVTSAAPRDEYNRACNAYRKGQLDQAEQLLHQGATSEDPTVRARSLFNLGDVAYRRALTSLKPKTPPTQADQPAKPAQPDRPAAITHLDTAIARYREALDVEGQDRDARVNIELAQRLKKQLREEQKKEDEKKKQDQQKKDQQDKQDKQDQKKQDQQKQDKQDKSQDQQKQDKQDKQDESKGEKKEDDKQDKSEGEKKEDDKQDKSEGEKKEDDKQDKAEGEKKEDDKQDKSEGEKKEDDKQDKSEGEKKEDDKQDKSEGEKKENEKQKPSQGEQDDKQESPDEKKDADAKAGEGEKDEKPDNAKSKPQAGDQGTVSPKTETAAELDAQHARRMLQAVRDRQLERRKLENYRRQQQARRRPVQRDW